VFDSASRTGKRLHVVRKGDLPRGGAHTSIETEYRTSAFRTRVTASFRSRTSLSGVRREYFGPRQPAAEKLRKVRPRKGSLSPGSRACHLDLVVFRVPGKDGGDPQVPVGDRRKQAVPFFRTLRFPLQSRGEMPARLRAVPRRDRAMSDGAPPVEPDPVLQREYPPAAHHRSTEITPFLHRVHDSVHRKVGSGRLEENVR